MDGVRGHSFFLFSECVLVSVVDEFRHVDGKKVNISRLTHSSTTTDCELKPYQYHAIYIGFGRVFHYFCLPTVFHCFWSPFVVVGSFLLLTR